MLPIEHDIDVTKGGVGRRSPRQDNLIDVSLQRREVRWSWWSVTRRRSQNLETVANRSWSRPDDVLRPEWSQYCEPRNRNHFRFDIQDVYLSQPVPSSAILLLRRSLAINLHSFARKHSPYTRADCREEWKAITNGPTKTTSPTVTSPDSSS